MTALRSTNRNDEIGALTGVRGVAASMVVAYHFSYFGEKTHHLGSPVGPGYLAVDLFFVLSGFVMAMSYGRYFAGPFRLAAYGRFFERRFARIYPVYLLLTLLAFAMAVQTTRGAWAELASNLLLIQQLGVGVIRPMGVSLVGQAWSISAEFGAYILFPALVALVLNRSPRLAGGLVALCLVAVFAMAYLVPPHAEDRGPLDIHWGPWGLARCLVEFSLGLATWRAWRGGLTLPAWTDLALPAALAALWFAPWGDPLVVCLFPLLVLRLTDPRSWLAVGLASAPLYFLGEISYSLYLVHPQTLVLLWRVQAALSALHAPHAYTLALVVLFGLDILVATLLFQAVERPCRRWLRIAFERRRPPPIMAEPAAP